MRRIWIILLMIAFSGLLFSQGGYMLRRSVLSSTGGRQSNSNYTTDTLTGQGFQGSSETEELQGFFGFFYPCFSNRQPVIASVNDVPNDQGRKVQVLWNRSCLDIPHSPIPITTYSVWRFDEVFTELPEKNIFPYPGIVLEHWEADQEGEYYWLRDDGEVLTFITHLPALQNALYAVIAPTLFDLQGTVLNYSKFEVIAHTDTVSIYYESRPDSGYSLDNITPNPVQNIDLAVSGTELELTWEAVSHGSFQGNLYPELNGIWYIIYGSDQADFECNQTNLINITQYPNYLHTLGTDNRKFFRIVVSDQPVEPGLCDPVGRSGK